MVKNKSVFKGSCKGQNISIEPIKQQKSNS